MAAHATCLNAVQGWDNFVAGSTASSLLTRGKATLNSLNVKPDDKPPASLTARIAQVTQSMADAEALEATDPGKAKADACAALATLPALKKDCDIFNAKMTYEQQEGVMKVNETFADYIVRLKSYNWDAGADQLAGEYKKVRAAAAVGDFILANTLRKAANIGLEKARKKYNVKFDDKVTVFKEEARKKPAGSAALMSSVLAESEIAGWR